MHINDVFAKNSKMRKKPILTIITTITTITSITTITTETETETAI